MNPIQSIKDIIGIMKHLQPKTAGILQEAIDELTNPDKGYYQIEFKDKEGDTPGWCAWDSPSLNLENLKNRLTFPDMAELKAIANLRIIQVNKIETVVYEEK